jgi:hypothetical protein
MRTPIAENLDWERWLGARPESPMGPWTPRTTISPGTSTTNTIPAFIGNLLSHRFYALMIATGQPEYPAPRGLHRHAESFHRTATSRTPRTSWRSFPSGLTFMIVPAPRSIEIGLPDTIRGRHATACIWPAVRESGAPYSRRSLFTDELDAEEFNDPTPFGRIETSPHRFL